MVLSLYKRTLVRIGKDMHMNEKTAEQYQDEIKQMINDVSNLTFLKRLSIVLSIETKNSKQEAQGV